MPSSLLRVLLGAVFLVACLALWRWLEALGWLDPAQAEYWLNRFGKSSRSPWLIAGLILLYPVALLVMFPLTLLVVTTGLLFGPAWGLVYATLGTLISSALSFWVGYFIGRDALNQYAGRRLTGLNQYLADRGIRTMVLINLLPLAPFTLTNMLAGASHIRFSHYLIGSVVGILPGLAAVTLLGSQLSTILFNADAEAWLRSGLVVLVCAIFLGVLARLAKMQSGR